MARNGLSGMNKQTAYIQAIIRRPGRVCAQPVRHHICVMANAPSKSVTEANWISLHPWKPSSPLRRPLRVLLFSHAYVPLTGWFISNYQGSAPRRVSYRDLKAESILRLCNAQNIEKLLTVATHESGNIGLYTTQKLAACQHLNANVEEGRTGCIYSSCC